MAMTFESPDDEFVAMTASPEAMAAVAEGLMKHEITPEVLDRETGMELTPMAQMTVLREDGAVEASVFMSKRDLIQHIYECRSILKTMDRAAKLADEEMRVYRDQVRRRG
jgi:hypothetical protein